MEAVKRLREVSIFTLFVLSIFALIGLQLFKGMLKHHCLPLPLVAQLSASANSAASAAFNTSSTIANYSAFNFSGFNYSKSKSYD